MKRGLVTLEKIQAWRRIKGICPICEGPLKWNIRSGRNGQFAHLLCDTKPNRSRYGDAVIESPLNGLIVCDLPCNNAIQLKYGSRPVLCDELAEEIKGKLECI